MLIFTVEARPFMGQAALIMLFPRLNNLQRFHIPVLIDNHLLAKFSPQAQDFLHLTCCEFMHPFLAS